MERNRLIYVITGVLLLGLGYAVRFMRTEHFYEGSTLIIAMGMYFFLALVFRKAAAWVLTAADLILCGGLQGARLLNIPWYNRFYDSPMGLLIIGGPFEFRIFIYILFGTLLGAFLEIVIRQFNSIGLGN